MTPTPTEGSSARSPHMCDSPEGIEAPADDEKPSLSSQKQFHKQMVGIMMGEITEREWREKRKGGGKADRYLVFRVVS